MVWSIVRKACVPIGAIGLASCATPVSHETTGPSWVEIPNQHAQHFSIRASGSQREVLVFGPGGRSDTIATFRVNKVEDGRSNALPSLDRIAMLSTTHLSYIAALGKMDHVVAAAYLDKVKDPIAREWIMKGAVREVGTADGVDREQMVAANVDAIFDYPFGQATHRAAGNGQVFVPVTEYLEEHPLGRAEWIRFFGVLLNAEARADSLYIIISERYTLAAAHASAAEGRPRVFFGSSWQGNWHVPPGNSYMATLIHDAGGAYCFVEREGDGNIPVDLETVIAEGKKADYFGIVVANGRAAKAELIGGGDARIASLPSITRGGFVLDSERSDIFGQALLEPDMLLQELACTFHPGPCKRRASKYVFEVDQ